MSVMQLDFLGQQDVGQMNIVEYKGKSKYDHKKIFNNYYHFTVYNMKSVEIIVFVVKKNILLFLYRYCQPQVTIAFVLISLYK